MTTPPSERTLTYAEDLGSGSRSGVPADSIGTDVAERIIALLDQESDGTADDEQAS
jgi:hypothetical protein